MSASPAERHGCEGDTCIPGQRDGLAFASLETPCDELTGVPYAVAPAAEIREATKHHTMHPSDNPTLTDSLGGRALRSGRLQVLTPEQHNLGPTRYHRFYGGPPIPAERAAQLGLTIFLNAGFIPDQVIDTSRGEPATRPIKDWEMRRLQMPSDYMIPRPKEVKIFRDGYAPDLSLLEAKQILVDKRKYNALLTYRNVRHGFHPVRAFIVDYLLNEGVDALATEKTPEMERFKADGNISDGLVLFGACAYLAVANVRYRGEPLTDMYRELHQADRFNHYMPDNAIDFVLEKIGPDQKRIPHLVGLRSRLLANEAEAA